MIDTLRQRRSAKGKFAAHGFDPADSRGVCRTGATLTQSSEYASNGLRKGPATLGRPGALQVPRVVSHPGCRLRPRACAALLRVARLRCDRRIKAAPARPFGSTSPFATRGGAPLSSVPTGRGPLLNAHPGTQVGGYSPAVPPKQKRFSSRWPQPRTRAHRAGFQGRGAVPENALADVQAAQNDDVLMKPEAGNGHGCTI